MRGWAMTAWATVTGTGIGSAITYRLGLGRLIGLLDALNEERDKLRAAREEFVGSAN